MESKVAAPGNEKRTSMRDHKILFWSAPKCVPSKLETRPQTSCRNPESILNQKSPYFLFFVFCWNVIWTCRFQWSCLKSHYYAPAAMNMPVAAVEDVSVRLVTLETAMYVKVSVSLILYRSLSKLRWPSHRCNTIVGSGHSLYLWIIFYPEIHYLFDFWI